MVRLLLSIKAELENVTDLQPATEDFEYFFEVKCTQCNEVHPKFISINREEEYEVAGGRGGMANFVWKCGICKREASARFEPLPTKPYSSGNELFEPFLTLDCRNLEFVGFDPKGTWKCVGSKGYVFSDVELDGPEDVWTDYDEKAGNPVGVSNVVGEWSRA